MGNNSVIWRRRALKSQRPQATAVCYSPPFKARATHESGGMIFNFLSYNCEISVNSACVDFITGPNKGG
jgi:hypothetical protein